MDKTSISLLLKMAKPFIGGKLPTIEVVCPDKQMCGLNINGKFMPFAELEQELSELGKI